MNASAATGRPIAPSSTALRAVWMPPPRNVSGALPTSRFFLAARARTLAPSLELSANGFSQYACLPALSARTFTSAWAFGTVRFTTTSTSGSLSRSFTVAQARIPYWAALAWARAGSKSAQATMFRMSNFFEPMKYASLILPQPTIPTFTLRDILEDKQTRIGGSASSAGPSPPGDFHAPATRSRCHPLQRAHISHSGIAACIVWPKRVLTPCKLVICIFGISPKRT